MAQVQFQQPTADADRVVYINAGENADGQVELTTKIGPKWYGSKLSPAEARRVSSALLFAADLVDGAGQ